MIKGIGRQVVVLNNTDSEIFEQAIFILKANGKVSRENMVKECERMINAHVRNRRRTAPRNYWKFAFFGMSALTLLLAVLHLT